MPHSIENVKWFKKLNGFSFDKQQNRLIGLTRGHHCAF